MITQEQYVPILKGKLGEYKALQALIGLVKDNIKPVIDIVPIPPDFENEVPSKTIDEHLKSFSDNIYKHWEADREIYIDGYMIIEETAMNNGLHPMIHIFNELESKNINAIPVTGNERNIEYNRAVSQIIERQKKGVCLRIFSDVSVNIKDEIKTLLDFLKVKENEVDLIIDLRSIIDIPVRDLLENTSRIIERIPALEKWRSFVISATAFPNNLSNIPRDQIEILNRSEWMLWQEIVQHFNLIRNPSFSDYAISHPEIVEIDPRLMSISASIRYTADDSWYIYRGRSVNQYGYEQFFDLSETLINRPEYAGRDHCFGDDFIYRCGTDKEKTGNHTTWRQVGTNHHITMVVNQLRQFWRDFNAERTS